MTATNPTIADLEAELVALRAECAALRQQLRDADQGRAGHMDRSSVLRVLLEHLPILLFSIDIEGHVLYTGPSIEHLLGYTPEQIGRAVPHWLDLFPESHRQEALQALQQGIQTGVPFSWAGPMCHRDGSLRDLACTVVASPSDPRTFHGLALDVTDRTEQEARTDLMHEALLDSRDGQVLIDPQLRVLVANPAARQILGVTREEDLLGSAGFEHLCSVCPDELRDRLRGGLASQGCWRGLVDMPAVQAKYEGTVNTLASGAMVISLREATPQQTNEALLRSHNERLQEADRFKTTFLRTVSHELRTPLTSIMGFSELLLDELAGGLDEEQLGFVRQIQLGSEQLRVRIDDMLDFVRLEAGTFALATCEADVSALLGDLKLLFGPEAAAAQVGLSFELPAEPLIWVLDPRRIAQVISNLVNNAVKFTRTGGAVQVRAWIGEGRLELEVSDTGIGIAPQHLGRIFEKFYQVDPSVTRVRGGAGLGLAMARALVEAHEGRLTVDSCPGQGSSFRCSLPPGRELELGADFTIPDRTLVDWIAT